MRSLKLFLLVLVVAGSTAASAQTRSRKPHNPIPEKGKFMIELGMLPFSSEEVFNFDAFHGKYWLSDRLSLRLGFEINSDNSKEDPVKQGSTVRNREHKSFTFGIKPGVEYRLIENSKVSPYVGLEAYYRRHTASSKSFETIYDGTMIATSLARGGWIDTSGSSVSIENRAYKAFGANLFLGLDIFVVRNLYFGAEIGLGYGRTKFDKADGEWRSLRSYGTSAEVILSLPEYRQDQLSFYANPRIRLGVWF